MTRTGWVAIVGLAALCGCKVGRAVVDRREPGPELTAPPCKPLGCEEDLQQSLPPPRDPWPLTEPPLHPCVACPCTEVMRGDLPPQGERLELAHVTLAAESPLMVALTDVELTGVVIDLSGPVRLRVERSVLSNVQLRLEERAGEPRVELEGSEVNDLVVVPSAAATPSGVVRLERTRAAGLQVEARELEMASVRARYTRLSVDQLRVADTDWRYGVAAVVDGLVATSTLFGVTIADCGALTVADASAEGSTFGPCSLEPLRMYAAALLFTDLEGQVEMETSHVTKSRFGSLHPTTLIVWASTIATSTFCAGARELELGSNSVVCTVCGAELLACELPEEDVNQLGNDCPALQQLIDAPDTAECLPPFPVRDRR